MSEKESVLSEAFDRWYESMGLSGEGAASKLVARAHFAAGWEAAYGDAMAAALRFAEWKAKEQP